MKDAAENPITVGQILERIDGDPIGHRYKVISGKWDKDDSGDSLIADGGFIKDLLTEKTTKEFRVVDE